MIMIIRVHKFTTHSHRFRNSYYNYISGILTTYVISWPLL